MSVKDKLMELYEASNTDQFLQQYMHDRLAELVPYQDLKEGWKEALDEFLLRIFVEVFEDRVTEEDIDVRLTFIRSPSGKKFMSLDRDLAMALQERGKEIPYLIIKPEVLEQLLAA